MLHIPAPTAQDRTNQWVEAYNAAETLVAKAFEYNPQLMCDVTEVSLELLSNVIAEQYDIPVHIAAAAAFTAVNDLHEQYHNPA